ncbi:MAG: NrsF family protein [Pararobbsia sp.]
MCRVVAAPAHRRLDLACLHLERRTAFGAGVGLFAGAQAVLVHTLYCVETAVPFWGVW